MPNLDIDLPINGSPNASEEPKIITALSQIQSVINELDTANLATVVRNALLPAGAILQFGGSAAPEGFLLCNGQEVSAAFPELISALSGNPHGVGPNGRPKVPDMRGRVPVGSGTGPGLTARALGAAAGAESVALGASQLPSHTHPITDPGHGHNLGSSDGGGGTLTENGGNIVAGVAGGANTTLQRITNGTAFTNLLAKGNSTGITGTNGQAGPTGQTHENMPPYVAVQFVIRHGA